MNVIKLYADGRVEEAEVERVRIDEVQKFVHGWAKSIPVEYRFRPWLMVTRDYSGLTDPDRNRTASDIAGVTVMGDAMMLDGQVSP